MPIHSETKLIGLNVDPVDKTGRTTNETAYLAYYWSKGRPIRGFWHRY